jgi:valyl-tRNA synthetase
VIDRAGRLAPVTYGTDAFPSHDPAAANAAYAALAGKSVKEAQKQIVELLRDPAGAALKDGEAPLAAEPEPIEHPVKFFEKGDRPLEFITTRQWFARILEHKDALVARGDAIRWHPDFMRLRYRNWTENLQLDWCVSRQRYFGVPFPVWYAVDGQGATDYARPLAAAPEALPVDPLTDVPPGFTEAQRDQPNGFRAEADVFDTWFTSSLTPQIATGWLDHPERHRALFPMDLRPQSHEIIRTWAFYTIAKAHVHADALPWAQVAISGWVLDPDRKKMSKSKGNVITPMHLLDQYGADAVRYWSLSARLGTDTAFDEKVLKVGRRLVTKLFNASKYVLGQTGPEAPVTAELDRAFLFRLRDTVDKASGALAELDYASALDAIERSFWSGFTDTYVEMVKGRARAEGDPAGRGSAVAALQQGLRTFVRLFAPFLPYITEEVWSWGFGAEAGVASVHLAPWPSAAEVAGLAPLDDAEALFRDAAALLEAVNRAKTAAGGSVGRHLDRLVVAVHPRTAARIARVQADVLAAARVSAYRMEAAESLAEGAVEVREAVLAEARPEPPPAP